VRQVEEVQRPEGYRLVAAFEDGEEEACAVAGFRLDRVDAHRFYMTSGLVIAAHHFARYVE
jgi:hypothetical protein